MSQEMIVRAVLTVREPVAELMPKPGLLNCRLFKVQTVSADVHVVNAKRSTAMVRSFAILFISTLLSMIRLLGNVWNSILNNSTVKNILPYWECWNINHMKAGITDGAKSRSHNQTSCSKGISKRYESSCPVSAVIGTCELLP